MRSTTPDRPEGSRIRIIGTARPAEWTERLSGAGYDIDWRPITGPDGLQGLEHEPPDAGGRGNGPE